MKILVVILACAVSYATYFGGAQDNTQWGEKFNSNGAALVLKEIARHSVNGQTVITYNLFASGLPKNAEYTLFMKQLESQPQALADAFINQEGLVVNVLADPAHGVAEDPINLKVSAGRGEPKRFAVISNDGHNRASVEATPFPIENSVGSCKISATMMSRNYSGVQILVTGLQPKEEIQIDSHSGSEEGSAKGTTEDDGSYRALLFPFVKGQTSGTLRFNVKAKACSVGVQVPWGVGSYVIQ